MLKIRCNSIAPHQKRKALCIQTLGAFPMWYLCIYGLPYYLAADNTGVSVFCVFDFVDKVGVRAEKDDQILKGDAVFIAKHFSSDFHTVIVFAE